MPRRRSAISASISLTLALSSPLGAQVCFLPRPEPECRVVLLTNAGGFVNATPSSNGESVWRAIVDWGFLQNTGPRQAFGASFFVMLDEDEFSLGPALRYRRWFSARRSLDIAVGTPISQGDLRPGSVLGLIKYNPERWVGFALRPEIARRREFSCTTVCNERISTSGRVYGGVEWGGYPGLVLSLGGGVALGALIIVLAGID